MPRPGQAAPGPRSPRPSARAPAPAAPAHPSRADAAAVPAVRAAAPGSPAPATSARPGPAPRHRCTTTQPPWPHATDIPSNSQHRPQVALFFLVFFRVRTVAGQLHASVGRRAAPQQLPPLRGLAVGEDELIQLTQALL